MKICSACNGRGQTKATRTEFHFEAKRVMDGRIVQQYKTDKQGSGCPNCGGTGKK